MTSLDDVLAAAAGSFPEGAGPVGLLSGDEFLPDAVTFDRALLARGHATIGLVLCASHRGAAHSAALATDYFSSLGATVTARDLIHGEEPDALDQVDAIYVAGGSPPELLACLAREPAWQAVLDAWRSGTALIGTSAGAMALCEHCLTPEDGATVPTVWGRGAGPVAGMGVAVHATSRPRDWLDGIANAAAFPVVALDDHTGVLLARDRPHEVAGPGKVWVIPRS